MNNGKILKHYASGWLTTTYNPTSDFYVSSYSDGQVEQIHYDGTKKIKFSDNSIGVITKDAEEYVLLHNGNLLTKRNGQEATLKLNGE